MSGDPSLPEPGLPPTAGPDLARAALNEAKARAREKGLTPRTSPRRRGPAVPRREPGDVREPEIFGAAIQRLVAERGWQETTSAARVVGAWRELVGDDIADHCTPQSLIDGELVLVAVSSAWATQLRLMSRTLLQRLAERAGQGVVQTLVVRGPNQVDWRRGPRVVRGRGPRDTYG